MNSVEMNEILIAASAIRSDIDTRARTASEIDDKYARIKEKYPKFYQIICTDTNAVRIITFMLYVMNRKESGEITSERGDVEIGQFMANLYLPTEAELANRS